MSQRGIVVGLFVLAAVALALRLPQLDRRPMHCDEAVHALKLQGLWEKGIYRYDPNEYHGPSLYYATLPVLKLGGVADFAQATEVHLRLVPVLFGVGCVLLLGLLADGLGRTATWCAGALIAISPAMVFYSRYFIHEMPLLFFTLMFLGGCWRYVKTQRLGWLLLAGAGAGLMHATKETFVFTLAAAALALVITLAWHRWQTGQSPELRPYLKTVPLVMAALVALAVSVTLFSSFFTNANGPLDSIRTYLPWLNRAQGNSPHVHPWHYYLGLLAYHRTGHGPIWSEGLILVLALVGGFAAFSRTGLAENQVPFARFLALYTLGLTAIYGVIAYKTPWCLLSFLQGMILLAGLGVVALLRWFGSRSLRYAIGLLLLVAAGQLTGQAVRASYTACEDTRNPYVYAHTVSDITRLTRTIVRLSRLHPDGDRMLMYVISTRGDYWPLPWYLRQFKRVGWTNQVPNPLPGAVIVNSPKWNLAIEEQLGARVTDIGFFALRPATFLQAYVETNLWQSYVKSRKPGEDED